MKNLPNGWKKVELSEILESIENGNRPKGGITDLKDGIPSIGGEHINSTGGFNLKNVRLIPYDFYSSMKRGKIQTEDVLVVKDGATTGKVSLVDGDFPYKDAAVNEHVFILRGKKDLVNQKFLFYHLYSPIGQRQMDANFHGAAIGGINTQFVKNYNLVLPPLPTQKKIAAVLEKAEKLREWRKEADGLMDKFLKSTFLEMFGDPIKNPKKWELVKLAKVGSLKRGKSKHRPRDAPELLGGPYPLIQTGDVAKSGGYIRKYDQTYSELGLNQSKMWPSGTLCITIAANIAKTGVLTFDSCFPDSVVGFIPNNNTKTEYVQFWLSFLQKMLEETAPESAQKNINLEILSNLNIPFPTFELQQKFASIVQQVEQIREHQTQSRQHIENFFNVLMQRAFRGELEAK